MKKIVGTVAALAVLGSASAFAASFDPSKDQDVVGYYTFNDGVKDNEVIDHSVNGFNVESGCVDGSVTVEGLDGLALRFNGSDEYIQLDPEALTGDGFTFAAWIKADQWTTWARVFDMGDTKKDIFLGVDGRAAGTLVLWEESSTQCTRIELPKVDQWVHVAATFGDGKYTIYINGKKASEAEGGISAAEIGDTASGLYVGRSNWADPYFKGAMDEIVVAKRVLNADEINALYAPLSKKAKSIADAAAKAAKKERDAKAAMVKKAGKLSLSATEGIVGYYTFESFAADDDHEIENTIEGGNSIYTGSLDDSVLTKGKSGKALLLKNSEYIDLDEEAFENDGVTIAMWVNATAWTDWSRIFDLGNQMRDAWLGVEGGSSKLRLDAFGATKNVCLTTELPPVGKWTHVAVTLGDGYARLYVNGILEGEAECDVTASLLSTDYRGLYVGRSNWTDPLFSGIVDDLLVADRALSAKEIAAAYNGIVK